VPPKAEIMTSDLEGQADGVPYGLVVWGQAGAYNAVDDRQAITAVSDSMTGVVRPAVVTAGSGLTLNIAAGWLAIASCHDGTTAVVGARQSHQLQAPAGQAGAGRNYWVWVDTDPDGARWEMRLVLEADTVDRPGVGLARVQIPAGTNLATQFVISTYVPVLGRHASVTIPDVATNRYTVAGTGFATMTPAYPIAPWQFQPDRCFVLRAYGDGLMGSGTPRNIAMRITPVAGFTLWFNTGVYVGSREWFDWECELIMQVQPDLRIRQKVSGHITRRQDTPVNYNRSISAVRSAVNLNPYATWLTMGKVGWAQMALAAAFDGATAGQRMSTLGATFESYEAVHPGSV
jgi:hypothetical protein